jgi:biotin transport system substrate-specific component
VKAAAWTQDRSLAGTRPGLVMALGSVLFAVLTAAGAAVAFPLPFSPVPVTLQTLFVVLSGAMLGPVWGPLSQVMYVGAGASGLPVFAGGTAGAWVLAGPTGGYLVGFVIASWVAGLLTRPGASWARLLVGLLAAHATIFLCGVSHLMLFAGRSATLAVQLGFFPYLPGLAIKTLAAAGALRTRRVAGWFRS